MELASKPNQLTHVHCGYDFFNFWNEIKFLGFQSVNFYLLSISALIFYSETKNAATPNTLMFSRFLAYFNLSITDHAFSSNFTT